MAPSNSNPPSLPPTVEEAYRRKCIQLKQRSKEIDDENHAYRLRLMRLERQVQKARLERAFLLEQIAKRTSTNVEDSEGSPSPAPTVRHFSPSIDGVQSTNPRGFQPEDKPMRVKRGHKSSLLASELASSGPTFINDNPRPFSPMSDTFSHDPYTRNGIAPKPPKRPSNGFEIYCNDTRPLLQQKHKEEIANGEYQLEQELAKGWKDLTQDEQAVYQKRYEEALKQWKEERDAYRRSVKDAAKARRNGHDEYLYAPSRRGRGSGIAPRHRSHLAQQDDEDVSVVEDQGDEQDIEMGDADQAEEDAEQGVYDPETEPEDDEQERDQSD
ncbi:hmg box protein [Seiridium cupressi]